MTTTKKMTKAKKQVASSESPVLQEVQKLYKFMQENRLETLEYDQQDVHIRLTRKHSAQIPIPVMSAQTAAAAHPHHSAEKQPPAYTETIKSPLMGIFYRASSPSSPPFAREGETVKAGNVICLIEAMKVFNEVRADFDCTITKFLMENGKPVKAGQDLIAIEKK